mgnify:CR=1 FL=1
MNFATDPWAEQYTREAIAAERKFRDLMISGYALVSTYRSPDQGYAWFVVAILMIVYIFSFIDRQIISLPNPPLEDIAEGAVANNLAKVANDSMAELCSKYPDRFPAFAAAVKRLRFGDPLDPANFAGPLINRKGVEKVLNAAALTYVAAFVTSLAYLLWHLLPLLLGGRSRE